MRSLLPPEVQTRQREVLDRIEALVADGLVADAGVTWWSDRVCPPETAGPLGGSCPAIVRDLLTLADALDLDLAPAFDRHARLGGGDDEVIVLPVIALVVREAGTIVGVYPITHGGRRYTVEDCLVALEAGDPAANLQSELADSA